MLIKSKAIVIKTIKYGDQKLIVDFVTAAHGRMSSMVKIPAKGSSGKGGVGRGGVGRGGSFPKQFFQPLTILTIETDYRERESLQKIVSVSIAEPCPSLHSVPTKITISLFLAEVLSYAVHEENRDEEFFSFLENSILWLDVVESGYANFHIAFLVRLLRLQGFLPSSEESGKDDIFDLHSGEFLSTVPLHNQYLQAADARMMKSLLRITYSNMHVFSLSRQERQRCLDIILLYCRIHIPSFPELKSLSVLREVFE